ncbi:MAG TPA: universal stress protein [Gammaproteobacteria bacterium]|nr:universal stress protein [Gammaproteobacteria bacterium]
MVLVHVLIQDPGEHELKGLAGLTNALGPQPVAPLHMDELVRAMAEHSGTGDTPTHEEALRQIGEQLLADDAATASANGAKVLRRDVVNGDPAQAILQAAESEGADLLVLGSRGLGGIRGYLLGSVSHHVSSHAGISCLTVR